MKKIPVILLLALFAMPAIYGQIKIGDNPQAISPTSVLELESNDRVLVITRINTQQMDAIVPNQGAMVYNTDTQCIHYYDGTQWVNLCAAAFEIPLNSISTEHIINGGVNGVDIQNGSIGPGKLQNQSVTQDKLSENSVGAFALDNDNINLSDFTNDLNLLTLSTDANNDIINNGGVFYDNQPVLDAIDANTAFINGHITADADTNATNEIQSLTLTGNQLGISGSNTVTLPGGGNATDELITNAVLTGTDLVITEAGTIFTVPLGSLGGGGTTEVADLTTILGIGTAGNPFRIAPGTDGQFLTTNTAGNPVWQTVAPGGGTTELADQATITGDGQVATPFQVANGGVNTQQLANDAVNTLKIIDGAVTNNKITPGAADQILRTATDGLSVQWVDLPTGGAVISDATLVGDGSSLANALSLADNAVISTKIANATILAVDLNDMGANDGDVLEWDQGAGVWAPVANLATGNEQDIALNITTNTIDLLEDDGTTISSSVLLDGTTVEVFNNGTDDVIQIADDAITLNKIADNAANDGDVMRWDNTAGEWIVEAAPGEHTGTSKSIFFADVNGIPDEALHPTNGSQMLIWDYESRVVGGNAYGTLGIGLDDTAINKNVKVHIEDTDVNDVTYPLELQNRGELAGTGLGILFANDRFNDGKGALVFERQGGFGVGDFHFLHNTNNGAREAPDLASDKAFTVRNNSDIVLYGGIDINGIGTGTNGQVLTSTGGGIQWGAGGGSGTIVSTDANNSISPSVNDGGAFYDDTTLATATAANAAALLLKEDLINKSTDVALGTSDTEYPSQNAVKSYVDTQIATVSGGTNLFSTDALTLTAARTHDLAGFDFNLDGSGSVGIGTNAPTNKLHVAGAIRAQGILNSDGTNGTPAYRFNGDSDTGMYSDVADDLAFSAGGQEILRLSESGANGLEILATGSLELEAELIDLTGDVGNSGQILSSTGAGVEWINAPTGGADGVVSNISTSGTELVVTGANGGFNGNVDLNPVFATDAELATAITASEALDLDKDDTNEIQIMSRADATMEVVGLFNNYTFRVGDASLTDAHIAVGADILGSKIIPNFGGQPIVTTGDINGNNITTAANLNVGADLDVTGNVTVTGTHTGIPDYVFQKYFLGHSSLKESYNFKNLQEIEAFVKKYHHLPGIKSAAKVKEDGKWNLGESNIKNLEKIEELFLHTIEQENKIKSLQSENETLVDELNTIKKDLEEIKSMLKKSN